MNRREFIIQSAKITGAGLISASLLGCDNLHDAFPKPYTTLYNGISWSNFQQAINNGSEGIYDTAGVYYPCVINDNGLGKIWYTGGASGIKRILYAESR